MCKSVDESESNTNSKEQSPPPPPPKEDQANRTPQKHKQKQTVEMESQSLISGTPLPFSAQNEQIVIPPPATESYSSSSKLDTDLSETSN